LSIGGFQKVGLLMGLVVGLGTDALSSILTSFLRESFIGAVGRGSSLVVYGTAEGRETSSLTVGFTKMFFSVGLAVGRMVNPLSSIITTGGFVLTIGFVYVAVSAGVGTALGK
jgi:hypothetical protein